MAPVKQVSRIGPFASLIPSGVRVGDLLTLSGQVSIDDAGAVVGPGNLEAQLSQAYVNVRAVMDEFGAPMQSIVDEMWLVTDIADAMNRIPQLFAIREQAFGGVPDVTQTMMQVAGLVMPELLIEVKCIAHL